MNPGKFVLGVVAGIAAGAVFGVLYAPKKGKNIRRDMLRKGEDLADALSDKVDEINKELRHFSNGKSKSLKSSHDGFKAKH